jgi:hypothetical protein
VERALQLQLRTWRLPHAAATSFSRRPCRTSGGDNAYGLQVCIGGRHQDIGGDGAAGGIAYVGVFGNPALYAYQTAFAFQE